MPIYFVVFPVANTLFKPGKIKEIDIEKKKVKTFMPMLVFKDQNSCQ